MDALYEAPAAVGEFARELNERAPASCAPAAQLYQQGHADAAVACLDALARGGPGCEPGGGGGGRAAVTGNFTPAAVAALFTSGFPAWLVNRDALRPDAAQQLGQAPIVEALAADLRRRAAPPRLRLVVALRICPDAAPGQEGTREEWELGPGGRPANEQEQERRRRLSADWEIRLVSAATGWAGVGRGAGGEATGRRKQAPCLQAPAS